MFLSVSKEELDLFFPKNKMSSCNFFSPEFKNMDPRLKINFPCFSDNFFKNFEKFDPKKQTTKSNVKPKPRPKPKPKLKKFEICTEVNLI